MDAPVAQRSRWNIGSQFRDVLLLTLKPRNLSVREADAEPYERGLRNLEFYLLDTGHFFEYAAHKTLLAFDTPGYFARQILP